MAERVVGRDVIEFLAVFLDQRAGDGVRLHLRGVADAEHVPVAARAGDRVGMAAGHDVQDALFVRDLRHGERQRRVDVAEQEIDLVAVDQLARLLHRRAGVAADRILDDELDRAAEDAALGVDLVERHLAADELVLARAGVGAGQRIVEADLDRVGGAGADDERTGELRGGKRRSRFDESAAVDAGAPIGLGQASLPCSDDFGRGSAQARWPTIRCLLIVRHFVLVRLGPSSRAAHGRNFLLEFHIRAVY